MRTRDRRSAEGLLPRMEAIPQKSGKVLYRYHPKGAKPISLGHDKAEAIRRVLDLTQRAPDAGTFKQVWRLYAGDAEKLETASKRWRELGERTRDDYKLAWKQVEKVFGDTLMAVVTQPMIRRYMMIERGGIKRANTEASLISNLYKVAIDHMLVVSNPCVGLEYIKVKPRKALPVEDELEAFLKWLRERSKQWLVIAAMAEFAARVGARRTEFLRATVFEVKGLEARFARAKQRGAQITDVIELTPEITAMLKSIQRDGCTTLFPTRSNRPYTESGFKGMWNKAKKAAKKEGIITRDFTFHDLKAHYVSKHKKDRGALPDIHKDPSTTARVYDRNIEVFRKAV
jgi:hypothetical protein